MNRRPRRTKPRGGSSESPHSIKLQRWIDLLALLLTRRYGVPLEEIRRSIPAYRAAAEKGRDPASIDRTFERDKNDLRALGIPIELRRNSQGDELGYTIDPREMYLPFLNLAAPGRPATSRRRETRAGYRAIPTLVFQPDELHAVLRGAQLAREMGDPLLVSAVESAIRKLTFDLPVGSLPDDDLTGAAVATARGDRSGAPLRAIGAALLRLKHVRFEYHAIGGDSTTQRTVEPYGLFLQSGHWYLAGRDVQQDAVRNFRVSRMSAVEANTSRPQFDDYSIPASFRLAEHARSRQAWELGDGDAREMLLEFRGRSGAVRAAAALGEPIRGAPRQRRFRVRRLDAFARWALSFGGAVAPVSPPELVECYRQMARDTLALYQESESGASP